MITLHSLALGFALGAFVAAQPGPVTFLTLRAAIRRYRSGLAVGAGVAIVDLSYAALGVAGAAPLMQLTAFRLTLGMAGAMFLLVIGARTLWNAWRVRAGLETADEILSTPRALATGLAATASNPLTIVSWAAVFAAATPVGATDTTAGAVGLIVGIGLGSFAWSILLAGGARLLLRKAGAVMMAMLDAVVGAVLVGFGGWLGIRTLTSQ